MEEMKPNGSHRPNVEWADEDSAAEEYAGAVYDEDDKMIAAFCGCVDCPDLLLVIEEPNDSFRVRIM